MRIYTFIITLSGFLFWGCQQDGNGIYKVKSYNDVKATNVEIKGIDSIFAQQICYLDDVILAITRYGENSMHLIDTKKQELIMSFGKEEGPDNFGRPSCYCQVLKDKDSSLLVVRELKGNFVNLLDLKGLAETKQVNRYRIEMPYIYLPKNIFLTNGRRDFVGAAGANGIFYKFNRDSREVFYSSERPKLSSKHSYAATDLLYTTVSDIDEKNGIFATAFILFNRIDLYELNGKFLQSIYFEKKRQIDPIVENDWPSQENIKYYTDLKIKDGKIYLLYNGLNDFEIEDRDFAYIHVLDLNGNLVKALKIDKPIKRISLSDNSSTAYGVVYDDGGNSNIYKFEI